MVRILVKISVTGNRNFFLGVTNALTGNRIFFLGFTNALTGNRNFFGRLPWYYKNYHGNYEFYHGICYQVIVLGTGHWK